MVIQQARLDTSVVRVITGLVPIRPGGDGRPRSQATDALGGAQPAERSPAGARREVR